MPGCGGCAVPDQSQDRCQDAEVFGSSKVCSHQAPFRPNLDAFVGIIDAILAADKELPKKQRHTVKRIFERLRDEQGFKGGMTIVQEFVAGWRQRTQERFVPLVHPPGYAHVDFGEALDVIGGLIARSIFWRWTCRTSMWSLWWAILLNCGSLLRWPREGIPVLRRRAKSILDDNSTRLTCQSKC